MADSLIKKHILKIDTICKTCGFHNKLVLELNERTNIVACGRCFELLVEPEDFSKEEKELVKKTIMDTVMKEEWNAG